MKPTQQEPKKFVTVVQLRHLKSRLAAVDYRRPTRDPDPPEIAAARKKVRAFDNKQSAQQTKAFQAWKDARTRVETTLYFKSPEEALAAIEEFEKKWGRRTT